MNNFDDNYQKGLLIRRRNLEIDIDLNEGRFMDLIHINKDKHFEVLNESIDVIFAFYLNLEFFKGNQ